MVDNGILYHSSCKNPGHNPAQLSFVSFGQLTMSTVLMLSDVFPETVYAVITFGTVPRDSANKLATLVTETPAKQAPTICPL